MILLMPLSSGSLLVSQRLTLAKNTCQHRRTYFLAAMIIFLEYCSGKSAEHSASFNSSI